MAYLQELFGERIAGDGILADTLLEDTGGKCLKCQNPLHPGPCAEGGSDAKPAQEKPGSRKPAEGKPGERKPAEGKPGERKPAESKPEGRKPAEDKPERGKPKPVIFGAAEQQHAEANQIKLAKEIKGGQSIAGNAPSDIEAQSKSIRHQLEMKTLLVNKKGRLKMTAAAMARKMERYDNHPPPPNVRQWTVAYDDRHAYASGNLMVTPSFPVYIREGVGRFAISGMHEVNSAEELNKILKTPAEKLPDKAKPPTEGFYAKWMQAKPRERKKIAQEAYAREQARIQKHKLKHEGKQ